MARAEGRWVGIGVASYAELTGVGPHRGRARHADQHRHGNLQRRHRPTGAVTASFGIASQGQGMETTLAQVAEGWA